MDNIYPTRYALEKIRKWEIDSKNVFKLFEYIKTLWRYSEYGGFKLTGVRVFRLELHTYGWSGNESIIDALYKNHIFWIAYWQKSLRGGHYYFKIKF